MAISLINPTRACRALPKSQKSVNIILAKTKPICRHTNQEFTTIYVYLAPEGKANVARVSRP